MQNIAVNILSVCAFACVRLQGQEEDWREEGFKKEIEEMISISTEPLREKIYSYESIFKRFLKHNSNTYNQFTNFPPKYYENAKFMSSFF